MERFNKDPGDSLDYGFKWSRWLAAGELIIESVWAFSGGDDLTLPYKAIIDEGKTTMVIASGGLPGERYVLTNTVTISGTPTKTKELSFLLVIEEA